MIHQNNTLVGFYNNFFVNNQCDKEPNSFSKASFKYDYVFAKKSWNKASDFKVTNLNPSGSVEKYDFICAEVETYALF